MSLAIRLLPEARAEYDAADWYEQQKSGLRVDFVGRVRTVLDHISANPKLQAAVYGDVRKARVSGYPYIVLYREEPGGVLVISLFYIVRDPSIWRSRS